MAAERGHAAAREREDEEPARVRRRRAEQRLVVGIAADDAVQQHGVRVGQLGRDRVAEPPLDALLDALLARQRARDFLVARARARRSSRARRPRRSSSTCAAPMPPPISSTVATRSRARNSTASLRVAR